MKKLEQMCSEKDCYQMVDFDDISYNRDGTYYLPSLKCWDCRTKNDRRNIKDHRRKGRTEQKQNNQHE